MREEFIPKAYQFSQERAIKQKEGKTEDVKEIDRKE
jgi:hypothetical protein